MRTTLRRCLFPHLALILLSHLCVTTCPDKWMPLLGRGRPAITTIGEAAKSYVSRDNVKSLSVYHAREDLGFYNIAFDRMCQTPDNMRYATSYGLQHNVGGDIYSGAPGDLDNEYPFLDGEFVRSIRWGARAEWEALPNLRIFAQGTSIEMSHADRRFETQVGFGWNL